MLSEPNGATRDAADVADDTGLVQARVDDTDARCADAHARCHADTRRTHDVVAGAIESGEVSRERVEEAAARVVALQLWQQRTADEVPVPADARERAAAAAAALSAAAYG